MKFGLMEFNTLYESDDISMFADGKAFDDWVRANCPGIKTPYNPKALIPRGHGKGEWEHGVLPNGVGSDAFSVAYIDGSTGFKHNGKSCGVAYYWYGSYYGKPTKRAGNNTIEFEALQCLLEAIHIKPLTIYTDSNHVQTHCKSRLGKDQRVIWQKRCSCAELKLVDTLASLCACSGRTIQGRTSNLVQLEKEFAEQLSLIYDHHYNRFSGKGFK